MEEADRVSTILNTLMDIAEAEAGLTKLSLAPLELATSVQDAIESYADVAEQRGVSVTSQVPLDLQLEADPTFLFRVLANLLENAIKYTPAGGSVSISAHRAGNSVSIAVDDTGVGISPEDLPRVWDRLFRGRRGKLERGLGLGLSFVRAIVEAHGGTASVQSRPGSGTSVTLSFPGAKLPQSGKTWPLPDRSPELTNATRPPAVTGTVGGPV